MNIEWDDYFMSLAVLVSLRSKDPNSKVGAVLVKDNKVIGTGYNGLPSGIDESKFTWDRDIDSKGWLNTKYPYVIHAEANALLNSIGDTKGSTIYVTLQPCNECAKLLIQAGIKRVNFLDEKYKDCDSFIASMKLLDVANVKYSKMDIKNMKLIIDTLKRYCNEKHEYKKL